MMKFGLCVHFNDRFFFYYQKCTMKQCRSMELIVHFYCLFRAGSIYLTLICAQIKLYFDIYQATVLPFTRNLKTWFYCHASVFNMRVKWQPSNITGRESSIVVMSNHILILNFIHNIFNFHDTEVVMCIILVIKINCVTFY
jgi:hypothetical protein